MCGICGIAGPNWTEQQLHSMVDILHHRGPDGEGSFIGGQVGIGNNRLSILDLSEDGSQPMHSPDGQVHIVLNGEIYNYLEIKQDLPDYDFASTSDTEVLLAAYLKWGKACLNRLIGMFAFAIWDERQQTLFVARDRFGVKPLYWTRFNGNLYFASEIKALFRAGVPHEPDEGTWSQYLTYGLYDHSDKTFWKDISSMPGGHFMLWKPGESPAFHQWYDLSAQVQSGAA
ncbi:MAG TPA: asparagine synthetase B, partial [Pseudodesulfovibrio sp.]|nr:asparagine synthetase B [Pseudodesulfovibrio sp.]